jgi:hypothetical protein
MFGLIKELADRFIEFVLRFVKGDTVEEQLTSALKSAVFLIAILGWLGVSMLMANVNLRMELADMESGVSKVSLLFDQTDGGPINSFIRINDSLNRQVNLIKQENMLLFKNNIMLKDENNFLRPILLRTLQDAERIKRNNEVLLQKCLAPSRTTTR